MARVKATYSEFSRGVNSSGWYVITLRNNITGRFVDKRKSEVAQLRREGRIVQVCACPTECDCQNPEPKSGVALVSEECPVHNLIPSPSDDCPVH